MRSIIPFNDDWLFYAGDVPTPNADFQSITLPHANVILPHHNFDNMEYQFISTYAKKFRLPEALNGRRLFVDFDGAMIASTVSINGHTLGDYEGGFTPFSFDLTDYVRADAENLLVVRLDSTERPDIPPYGGVVDYLTFGGIYRDVRLRYVELVHIVDVFVRTKDVLTANPQIDVHIKIANLNTSNITTNVDIELTHPDSEWATQDLDFYQVVVPAQGDIEIVGTFNATELLDLEKWNRNAEQQGYDIKDAALKLWSLVQPSRYSLVVDLFNEKNSTGREVIDQVKNVKFGIREAQFRDDGFYLNGEKIKLMGLNRHQTYPYIGAAAPARLQRKDADIVKYELGCNIVRTSHYPQSTHFLDRCDEIGLLVFEEIPGWQHIGDEDWQGISLRDVQAMIERDRNHPSIILWGVRINESFDNTAFYTATNALAHKLDPTRQTGGVRFWLHSEFLEDVYTFNDFSNGVQDPTHTPHMITEFNGHMFPTKIWDQEERVLEHALRHARVQNLQMGHPKVTGAIGWCAFDYNTHREFGSGDRICYHGVMDIFRLPKFAAAAYESQIPTSVRPVLRPATYYTMGDRSEGGIKPLVVFSNCDEVELYTGGDLIGRYQPDRENFPHLPHAPFVINGLNLLWGAQKFEDARFVGYVNGEAVIEHMIAGDGLPRTLVLEPDDAELNADGADMTRLVFKIVDKYGNRLPYVNQAVSFEIDGPAELIGENPFAIMGGQAALYVKARKQPGTVTIRASTARVPAATAVITIK